MVVIISASAPNSSRRRGLCLRLLILTTAAPVSCLTSVMSVDSSWGWTDRLGLHFSDECQEHDGLRAVFAWFSTWLAGGGGGRKQSANCETKEAACPPGLTVTGLGVKSGRMHRQGNRELYDFRLACGRPGQLTDWLGLRFDMGTPDEQGAGVCPEGGDAGASDLTGVQVARGRAGARDYYMFKLRCGKQWRSVVGLPFDALRETRSATCPKDSFVTGVRVHRGYQNWGSLDTYEFQLRCADRPTLEQERVAAEAQSRFGISLSELLAMPRDSAWLLLSSLVGSAEEGTANGERATELIGTRQGPMAHHTNDRKQKPTHGKVGTVPVQLFDEL